MDRDQEFVLTVVKYLVENPDDVKVDRKIDEMGVLLTLSVNPADMGKIIGKEGRTAKAIRTLLRVIGAKMDARVNLKIEEPEGSTYVRPASPGASQGGPTADAAATGSSSDDAASVATSTDDLDEAATDATGTKSQTSDVSGSAQPSSGSSEPGADFDPLATSKSIYGEDAASAGSNLDTDTSKPETDENPTSIL